jgi:tRNA(Ile)-lysidine synthase
VAREQRQSVEVAGRAARRAFLEDVRGAHRADRIATAHTQDDQAETVLLRLVRGTGRRGLGGIAPRRGRFIRPVLGVSRAALRAELRRRGHGWREDATNTDCENPRNRVRHELLPYLERHFNPSARATLGRLAASARSEDEWLTREGTAAAVHLVQRSATGVRVDREGVNRLPDALAARVVLHALHMLRPSVAASFHQVMAVLEVVRGMRAAADVVGVRAEVAGSVILLREPASERAPSSFRLTLPVPGEVVIPELGLAVSAEGPVRRDQVEVLADRLGSTLIVRNRRPGDRLRLRGVDGRKKLQDLFVDRKVPRANRDLIPVVTTAGGDIVWVAGHAVDAGCEPTEPASSVIILQLRRI